MCGVEGGRPLTGAPPAPFTSGVDDVCARAAASPIAAHNDDNDDALLQSTSGAQISTDDDGGAEGGDPFAYALEGIVDDEEEERYDIKRAERDAFVGISGFRKAASIYVPKERGLKCWSERIVVGGVQFTSDSATAIAIHARFIALGTQKGRVIYTDVDGNALVGVSEGGPDGAPIHHAAVTGVSVSRNGDVVATCSRDGTVCIMTPFDMDTQLLRVPLSDPLRTVSIDPRSTSDKHFSCVAGGKAGDIHHVQNAKSGWFGYGKTFAKGMLKSRALGVVHSIAYSGRGDLVAWGSDGGVACYDVKSGADVELPWMWEVGTTPAGAGARGAGMASPSISLVSSPSPSGSTASVLSGGALSAGGAGSEGTKCTVRFEENSDVLIAAWGNTIAAVLLLPLPSDELSSTTTAAFTAQLLYRTELQDATVCGVSPWGDAKLLALTLPTNPLAASGVLDKPQQRAQPQIRVLDRSGDVLIQESTYRLQLTGVENIFAPHYMLADDTRGVDGDDDSDPAFYVLTPKELTAVQPRVAADHISHLAARGHRDEALRCLVLHEQALRSELATREHDYFTVLAQQGGTSGKGRSRATSFRRH